MSLLSSMKIEILLTQLLIHLVDFVFLSKKSKNHF